MAKNIFSILLTVATISICCSKQASTQERRYSLSPPLAPFPCAAVNMEGNSITFRAGIVFVCNGKDLEEMPAGSIMGINAVCNGPTLIFITTSVKETVCLISCAGAAECHERAGECEIVAVVSRWRSFA
jgi:hypothetical protein